MMTPCTIRSHCFILKKFCVAASLGACQIMAQAAGPKPDFSVKIGPAILCRDKLDVKYLYDYLTASFGPSYKRDQGAYWFKGRAQLFGKEVKEIFITDQTGDWVFIGAVFKTKPDDLAKSVQTLIGPIYNKTDAGYRYSPYQTQGTSEIMWQNKDSKLFCKHFVGESQQ